MPPHGCDQEAVYPDDSRYRAMSASEAVQLKQQCAPSFESIGLEVHCFKIAWYNALVAPEYSLNYHDDTLAFLVISTPHMFELAFLPFLAEFIDPSTMADASNALYRDPIDRCMQHYFATLKQELSSATASAVDVIHDFELEMPSRRPKILLQTAAHVSGAAYYYKMNVNSKQRMGVCIHPAYGGWFGIRGAFILRDLLVADLPLTLPPDVVPSKEQQAELLRLFNDHWRDMTYRNCIPVKCRYSPLQVQYFALKPKDRVQFIKGTLFPLLQPHSTAAFSSNTHSIQNNNNLSQ